MGRFIFFIFFFIVFQIDIHAQIEKQDFIVLNKSLPKADTVSFEKWESSDTIFIKKIKRHHAKSREEITYYKIDNSWGNKYQGKKRLFDGKILVHEMGTERFIISGDTLYQITKGNSLSRDSLDVLFGRYMDPETYNKDIMEKNLDIIAQHNTEMNIAIFHTRFFKNDSIEIINSQGNCNNHIKLEKTWKRNENTYYAITADYSCNSFPKVFKYIIDQKLNIVGYEMRYISTELEGLFKIKPYAGIVHYD
ncbi:MAG: hypothetical protein JEZ03_13315 [Bacteroidales bacterium]|nr:hypothetical protein [Bacteroidales bacterium]